MVTEQQVRLDNIRDHQIGGINDGISHEVMEDIGFKPPKKEFVQMSLGATASVESELVVRNKNGRKLSMTPDAIRARERRAAKKAQTQANIRENSDPWGADLGGI